MADLVRAFAPATVANLGCGFDTLGFALEGLGDEVVASRRTVKGVVIRQVESQADLPTASDKNVAGIVATSVLERASANFGVELRLRKGMGVGTGLGSSAASAAAAGYAVNALLDEPLCRERLLDAVLDGEEAVSGRHADNAAPALFGGLILMAGQGPAGVRHLPIPDGLQTVLVSPEFRLDTRRSRGVLPNKVDLVDVLAQARNLAMVVDACHRNHAMDFISAVHDRLIEGFRLPLIPGASEAIKRCKKMGYAGTFLSGSGPTIAVICSDTANVGEIGGAISEAFLEAGLKSVCRVSPVGGRGARRLELE